MTNQVIPDAAVEAAAKWLHDNDCRLAVHSGHPADFECYDWLDEARLILVAAAPHMLAQAYANGHLDGMMGAPNDGPYGG